MLPIAKVMQKFEITKRSEDIFYYLKVSQITVNLSQITDHSFLSSECFEVVKLTTIYIIYILYI